MRIKLQNFIPRLICTWTSFNIVVLCSEDLQAITELLSNVADLNLDFIFVSAQVASPGCVDVRKQLTSSSMTLLGHVFTCVEFETANNSSTFVLHKSPDCQRVGFVFFNIEILDSTVLYMVGKTLELYNNTYSKNPMVFLSTSDDFNSTNLEQSGAAFLLNSDIYIINCQVQKMYELFTRKGELIIQRIYSTLDGLYFLSDKVKRRSNLMRSVFTATTVDDPTYVNWVTLTEDKNLSSGFSVDIYRDLRIMLNFTERVIIGDWIQNDANFTSLRGSTFNQLVAGEADISITQQGLLPYRAKHIQFLQPTYQGVMNAFFQQPETSAARNIVTGPFENTVWLCLGMSWLIMILSLKFILRIRQSSYWKESPIDAQFSSDAMMWAVAATCQKSWYISPTCASLKTTFLLGYVSSVICYVAYSAAIVSVLAVANNPVNGLADLITFKYIFTVHKNSPSSIFYLQELKNFKKLDQKIEKIGTVDEISHLVNPYTNFAFLSSVDNFYIAAADLNVTKHFLCSYISHLPTDNVPGRTGLFVSKGSDLVEILNYKIIMLKERGFNNRYLKNYDKITGVQCDSRDRVYRVGLTFTELFTAFLIVIIGFSLAFAAFLVERVYFKQNQERITLMTSLD